eukprot:SM000119S25634  [mRNA]  locus=s119:34028:35212:- [translate_table: standard]
MMRQSKDLDNLVAEAGAVLKSDENNLQALLLRGLGYYYLADHELALRHYQKGLRLDPEHQELKVQHRKLKLLEKRTKTAEEAFSKSKFRMAVEDYTSALQVDPEHRLHNVKLFLGLCKANVKLGRAKDAIAACTSVLEVDGNIVEAITQRAESKLLLEDFEGAVSDFRQAAEKDPQ